MIQKENFGCERGQKNGQKIKVLPDNLKRELVSKIESGEMNIDDVMRDYNIRYRSSIKEWLIKFGKDSDKYVVKNAYTVPHKRS